MVSHKKNQSLLAENAKNEAFIEVQNQSILHQASIEKRAHDKVKKAQEAAAKYQRESTIDIEALMKENPPKSCEEVIKWAVDKKQTVTN